jgi:hypothetical protein
VVAIINNIIGEFTGNSETMAQNHMLIFAELLFNAEFNVDDF